jgi:hypothetical protein
MNLRPSLARMRQHAALLQNLKSIKSITKELVLKFIKEKYCKFPDCLPHALGSFRKKCFPGEGG